MNLYINAASDVTVKLSAPWGSLPILETTRRLSAERIFTKGEVMTTNVTDSKKAVANRGTANG